MHFQYSFCLLVLFLIEMVVAVFGFVSPRAAKGLLQESLTDRIVHSYREDPDLQNFIDFAQRDVSILSIICMYFVNIITC